MGEGGVNGGFDGEGFYGGVLDGEEDLGGEGEEGVFEGEFVEGV